MRISYGLVSTASGLFAVAVAATAVGTTGVVVSRRPALSLAEATVPASPSSYAGSDSGVCARPEGVCRIVLLLLAGVLGHAAPEAVSAQDAPQPADATQPSAPPAATGGLDATSRSTASPDIVTDHVVPSGAPSAPRRIRPLQARRTEDAPCQVLV